MEIIKGNLYISELGQIVEALEDGLTSPIGQSKTFSGVVIEGNGYNRNGFKTRSWSYTSFKPYERKEINPVYEIY